MSNLKLKISDTQYLQIIYKDVGIDDCVVCTHCDIDYVDEKENITIRFGYEFISTLCYFLAESGRIQNLIDGQSILDRNNDPGFEFNQYYEGLLKDTDVIEKYHFQGNSHKGVRPYYESWLYNDKDGNIIFEITPFYPWYNVNKRTHPERIPFKEWIKGYKPTLKTIIPKERLLKWLEQAKALRKEIGLDF